MVGWQNIKCIATVQLPHCVYEGVNQQVSTNLFVQGGVLPLRNAAFVPLVKVKCRQSERTTCKSFPELSTAAQVK